MTKTSKQLKPLEPVDHERCQSDIRTTYRPFIMGGDVGGKWGRCKNKATWYAREVEPDKDGRRGSMSLCDECKPVCETRMGGKITFETLVGWNEKFHQLYDNPNCVPREEVQRVLRDAGADEATASAFESLIMERWRAAKK